MIWFEEINYGQKRLVSMAEFDALWNSLQPPRLMNLEKGNQLTGNYNYSLWNPNEKCWWKVHPEEASGLNG